MSLDPRFSWWDKNGRMINGWCYASGTELKEKCENTEWMAVLCMHKDVVLDSSLNNFVQDDNYLFFSVLDGWQHLKKSDTSCLLAETSTMFFDHMVFWGKEAQQSFTKATASISLHCRLLAHPCLYKPNLLSVCLPVCIFTTNSTSTLSLYNVQKQRTSRHNCSFILMHYTLVLTRPRKTWLIRSSTNSANYSLMLLSESQFSWQPPPVPRETNACRCFHRRSLNKNK